jgi:hypothetical protein
MSPAGDVRDEMTIGCLDEAFDRFLAGRPVPTEAARLVAFVNDVRAVAVRPGQPSPQLAELLATGLLTGPETAAARAVPTPGVAQPAGQQRRRRTMLGILAAATARLTSAGAVAQAATGLGIVLASVTGAGAAGVLPDPVQNPVSSVLEAVTPLELPDSADDRSTMNEAPAPQEEAPQDGESPAETPAQADFGRQVSEEAQGGGVDGQDVSGGARDTHQPDVPAAQRPATEHPVPARPTTSSDVPVAPGSSADERLGAGPARP